MSAAGDGSAARDRWHYGLPPGDSARGAEDPALLTLRTIDGLAFADVATWEAIGPERAALATVERTALALTSACCGGVRSCAGDRPSGTGFLDPQRASLAAATARQTRSSWRAPELSRIAIAAGPTRPTIAKLTPTYACSSNTRLQRRGQSGPRALQNRPYEQEHVPGSLRPRWRRMVWLAGVLPGGASWILAAGTLLVERAWLGACSAEIGRAALVAHRQCRQHETRVNLHRWDARALPVADGTVTRIVTNPPWGRRGDHRGRCRKRSTRR